jgi:CRP/FNR family transcriptional regulator, cyclic AMP receptor protein
MGHRVAARRFCGLAEIALPHVNRTAGPIGEEYARAVSAVGSSAFVPGAVAARGEPDAIGKDWVPILKRLPLFEGMSSRQLRRVPARAKRFAAGESIVRAGDPGNAFYVILDGQVKVHARGRRPATLGAGDSFGEMSLLDGAPRSATISAVGEVTTMVVARPAFAKLLRAEPQIAHALLRTLAARLRAAEQQY